MPSITRQLVSRLGVQFLRHAVPFILRHPFITRPLTLVLVLGSALGSALLVLVADPPPRLAGIELRWLLLTAIAAVLALAVAGLLGWRRYLARGGPAAVFLARFAPATPGAEEASLNHQRAVHSRLSRGPTSKHLKISAVPAALGDPDAVRLLEESSARAVVFGRVEAIAGEGTFRAVLLHDGSRHVLGAEEEADDPVDENQRTRTSSAQRHEFPPEYRVPLGRLIADRYEARHVDGVEAGLLVLLANDLLDLGQRSDAAELVSAAEGMRTGLTERLQAHHAVNRVRIDHPAPSRAALGELERAAEEVRHPDLRKLIAGLALVGHREADVPAADVVRLAQAAATVAPNEPGVRWMLGRAWELEGRADLALDQHLPLAERAPFVSDFGFQMNTGAMAYNEGQIAEARRCYQRALSLKRTARVHLYLADTYIRLEEVPEARHHYREALRRQPDLVDAHRGYWWKIPPGQEPRPQFFDRLYHLITGAPGSGGGRWRRRLIWFLLRWHYRRHPEDSRIHFMLGAYALLDLKLEIAEERLQFALDLNKDDLEALARLAVVWAHQGRPDQVRKGMRALRRALTADGRKPGEADLQERYVNLLLPPLLEEPRLVGGDGGLLLADAMEEVFGDIIERTDAGTMGSLVVERLRSIEFDRQRSR